MHLLKDEDQLGVGNIVEYWFGVGAQYDGGTPTQHLFRERNHTYK